MKRTIVLAKHIGDDKSYTFEVPEGMNIKSDDILYVDTMNGPQIAIATGDMATGEFTDEIIENMGAYLPLKKVLAYANKEIQDFIYKTTIDGIICTLENEKNECDPDCPF